MLVLLIKSYITLPSLSSSDISNTNNTHLPPPSSPRQGVVWGVYRGRVAVRERCCGGRSSLAPLPHPATMDVILGRDASMESVYARTPDPVTGQTVSMSPVTPQTLYQGPQTVFQPHNAQIAPVTQSV